MLPAALEQERLLIAERLLTEIERRHGLPRRARVRRANASECESAEWPQPTWRGY